MTRARGRRSRAYINREYPYKVIIPSKAVAGPQGGITAIFFANLGFRETTYDVVKDDEWHTVFCFRDPQHADSFISLFGGETYKP